METVALWGSRGICCAPVFSDTPQYQDWVAYHELMGVEGIHIYVAHVEGSKHKDIFGRGRAGHARVRVLSPTDAHGSAGRVSSMQAPCLSV